MALPKSLCDREQAKFKECDGQTSVRSFVCNTAADPIPVTPGGVPGGPGSGTNFFQDIDDTTVASTNKTLYSAAVPASTTRRLFRLEVSCRIFGKATIEAGGSVIGTIRTGAGNPNGYFEWPHGRDVTTGTTIAIKFETPAGPTSEVQAHLQAVDY